MDLPTKTEYNCKTPTHKPRHVDAYSSEEAARLYAEMFELDDKVITVRWDTPKGYTYQTVYVYRKTRVTYESVLTGEEA